jgi:hypothetical protein
LGACPRRQFQEEAFALPGDGRRLDYATAENHDFAALGVELGRRTGSVNQSQQCAGTEQAEQAARARQSERPATERQPAQQQKGADLEEQLGLRKGYEAGNQDTRSDDSQGPDERVLEQKPIVAGRRAD